MVWSYDEHIDSLALQLVIDIMQNDSDHTISLYTDTEVIETTAIHPFYTEKGWKDASELQGGDKIVTKEQEKVEIKRIEYNYQPKKVFNFEVAHWHTYFVGLLALLVHNAGRCLSELAKQGEKWAIDILRGIAFNKKANKEMLELANKKGLKYFSETWIKKGGKLYSRVDGYIPDKAIIERKATDLSKISPETAKSYINQLAKKYKEGLEMANKTKGDILKGQKFLQVDKIGNIPDDVLKYARDMDVTIVENIDDIFKLIGH